MGKNSVTYLAKVILEVKKETSVWQGFFARRKIKKLMIRVKWYPTDWFIYFEIFQLLFLISADAQKLNFLLNNLLYQVVNFSHNVKIDFVTLYVESNYYFQLCVINLEPDAPVVSEFKYFDGNYDITNITLNTVDNTMGPIRSA